MSKEDPGRTRGNLSAFECGDVGIPASSAPICVHFVRSSRITVEGIKNRHTLSRAIAPKKVKQTKKNYIVGESNPGRAHHARELCPEHVAGKRSCYRYTNNVVSDLK